MDTNYVETDAKGVKLCKFAEFLRTARARWDTFWEALANYIRPEKSEIQSRHYGPQPEKYSFLFDSTAIQANQTLAQGQMSLVSPADEKWFEFRPPLALKDDEDAIAYFNQATEIVREALAVSNFYTEIHEMYLTRSGFGTSAIFSGTYEGSLYFKNYDIGTFSIAENHRGMVDTFVREYPMTARQAGKEFGLEALPPSVREKANDHSRSEEAEDYIHIVMPREDFDPAKGKAANMKFASYHIHKETQKVVMESGYDDFAFHVSRYLRWSDQMTDPYGWCPGWAALPDIRQINKLQEYGDVLAETAAFPRIVAPDTLEGEVDLRGLGITYYNPHTDINPPQEWATQGRYDILLDRINDRRRMIDTAYHVDLFKMFATLEKQAQMSVREVAERSSEKLIQFSPTFGRLVTELFNPMLRRVFQLCMDLGMFSDLDIPESLVLEQGKMVDPGIRYTSRIAMAIQTLENNAALQALEMVTPVATVDPTVLDVFDIPTLVKRFGRNAGLPEVVFNTPAEIQRRQETREQLMIAQQESEIARNESEAMRARTQQ